MAGRRSKSGNILANRTASVSLNRNGLFIEIPSVPAVDAAQVSAVLLEAFRELTKLYPELTMEAGQFHSQPIDQPEEVDPPDGNDPLVAARRIGFHPLTSTK